MENSDKFFEFEETHQPVSSSSPIVLPGTNSTEIQSAPQHVVSKYSGNEEAIEKAKHEFDDVVSNAKAVDTRLAELLVQNKNAVQNWFPSKMQKLIAEKERLMVGTAMDFRNNLLKLGNQFRLEAMRDKYDVFLKCYKGQNRLILTQFMIQKLKELHRVVKVEEMGAFRELEEMYQNAATLQVTTMREKYVARIQGREDRLMDNIEKLIVRFESIIDENLTI